MARLRELAKNLKDDQVEILVVAIGDDVRVDEFKALSSGENTVFNPRGFNQLEHLYKKVALRSCKGELSCCLLFIVLILKTAVLS